MDEFREEGFCRVGTPGRGEVGELLRVDIEMAIIMVGQLLDPEFRQPDFLGLGDSLIVGHVGEMQRRLATPGVILR